MHAGFGANEEETAIDTDVGTTYQLMLNAEHRNPTLADELLARSEAYLRERGAKVIYAGGIRPLNGFYLGLYGGSELPGVLVTDPMFGETCLRNGYREIDRVHVIQLELSSFRPPVSRSAAATPPRHNQQRGILSAAHARGGKRARPARSSGSASPLAKTSGGPSLGDVWFWDIEPLSTSWGLPRPACSICTSKAHSAAAAWRRSC